MTHSISRRQLLKYSSFAAAAVAAPSVLRATPTKKQPNVVLIMADDLGHEAVECYGGTSHKTPRINKMAAEGMKFTKAYSQPVCTPTRVKIMTGQSNIRNYQAFSILGTEEKTTGHLMHSAGYKTAICGKWQLYGSEGYPKGIESTGMHPKDSGFETYCLWQIHKRGLRFWNPKINTNGKMKTYGKDVYGPDIFAKFGMDFMTANKDKPFFLYYPMVLTHAPMLPTPDSKNRKSTDKQKNFSDMLAYADKIVGKFIDHAEQLGIAENTLIIFTGDNGTASYIKSMMNGKLVMGGKASVHEYGNHVPFVAYWPGTIAKGKPCTDLIDFSDVYPTLAEIGGATMPKDIPFDGRSFLPQLRGEKGNPRDWYFCYYNPRPTRSGKEHIFAHDGEYKLFRTGEFYNTAKDPLQKNDLAGKTLSSAAQAAKDKLQAALDSMPAKALKLRSKGSVTETPKPTRKPRKKKPAKK
ncbi:MAG: sulfatase-like hydrolase/transferase [Phycisphaerales bacterium]|jgi:arylsulfatase A|nr:sulfatase-like hydrolase/transferase [Phycisphaerales bacterium]